MMITGRWERNRYNIIRALGHGGTGSVYLVRGKDGCLRAMKVSPDLTGITHEHRILAYLNQRTEHDETRVVPRVYELDDFQKGDTVYHYIITEYCPGKSLSKFKGRLSAGDTAALGRQIAGFLYILHSLGLVFGDLKPANVLYNPGTRRTFLIDYGGVCVKGQRLKQYTPGYDRANWGAGSRNADEQFDIFALGILLAEMILGKVHKKPGQGLGQLIDRVNREVKCKTLRTVIIRALRQEIKDCREIAAALSRVTENASLPGGRETNAFVSIISVASVLAFVLSLAYYYQ